MNTKRFLSMISALLAVTLLIAGMLSGCEKKQEEPSAEVNVQAKILSEERYDNADAAHWTQYRVEYRIHVQNNDSREMTDWSLEISAPASGGELSDETGCCVKVLNEWTDFAVTPAAKAAIAPGGGADCSFVLEFLHAAEDGELHDAYLSLKADYGEESFRSTSREKLF